MPLGDVAKPDTKALHIDLEKKFNPMYDGKDAPSTGPNLDLPKELQDPAKSTSQKSSNFYDGLPVFELAEHQIESVLTGKELAKASLKNGTLIEMKPKL